VARDTTRIIHSRTKRVNYITRRSCREIVHAQWRLIGAIKRAFGDALLSVCICVVVLPSVRLAVNSTVTLYPSRRIQGNRAPLNTLVYFFITSRCRRSKHRTTKVYHADEASCPGPSRAASRRVRRGKVVCPCPSVYAVMCWLSCHIGCQTQFM
jgi:hypothetical protein